MDWVNKKKLLEAAKKYRYILLILLTGMMLMLYTKPEETIHKASSESIQENPDLQESLSRILSKLYGAGKVEVLLTQASGPETIYQTDDNQSADDLRSSTVIVTNQDRAETGLIRRVNPPVYLGAIVLCQGADSAQVELSIVEAVASATGLSSDRITVLKMK